MTISRLLVIVAFVLSTTPSFGQNIRVREEIRVLNLENYFQNLEAVRRNGNLDIVRDGRSLYEYTVLEIPAGAMRVQLSYVMTSDETSSLHLVITNMTRKVSIKNTDGNTMERNAIVRLMYLCRNTNEVTCRETIQKLLVEKVQLQSLGVPNLEGMSSLPDMDLIFSFQMNSTGKIRW